MAILPLLKNPDSYRPSTWLLTVENGGLDWWTGSATRVARNLIDHELLRQRTGPDGRAVAFSDAMAALTQEILAEGSIRSDVDCFELDTRFSVLARKWGFDDSYADLKIHENEMACSFYPRHVEILDGLGPDELPLTLVQSVIAGNRFDLGCGDAIEDHHSNSPDFEQAVAELTGRPWHVDDYDAFCACFNQRPGKVLFFVDNAGADFVLGCLPLARALAQRGAEVIVAANSSPIVNDITAVEAQGVVRALIAGDPELARVVADGRLKIIDSGSDESLIDLSNLSEACVAGAEGVDLLILEGMGRALESNYFAQFTCPTLKICLLKAYWPASQIDGEIFDIVCRFDP